MVFAYCCVFTVHFIAFVTQYDILKITKSRSDLNFIPPMIHICKYHRTDITHLLYSITKRRILHLHFIAFIILMLRFYYLRAGLYTFMYSKDILFILKNKRFSSSNSISLVSPTFVKELPQYSKSSVVHLRRE